MQRLYRLALAVVVVLGLAAAVAGLRGLMAGTSSGKPESGSPVSPTATPASSTTPSPPAPLPQAGEGSERGTAPLPQAGEAADRGTAAHGSVLIRGVPFVRQKPDFCGEACAAAYLRRLGQPVDQDYVFDQSGLDPMLARGCYTRELATALGSIGFRVGPVFFKIPAADAESQLAAQWKALHADLAAGIPSIICTRYDARPNTTEHFRLILGYDAQTDEVIYHEPAEDRGAYRRMSRADMLSLWPLKYDARQWTLIRLRLEPGQLRRGEAAQGFTAADYAQHMMVLKTKIPAEGFTVVIQPPFVVLGDESPEIVRRRSQETVKWAVDRLKAAYFQKDPKEILDIWLFKDDQSYRRYAKEIFSDRPDTPYGYYSHEDRALVMNIATGGGTLVHEIVHPFMAADFPGCPAWFNEGLGSLYEQSGEEGGQIHGYTNWRLAGLQEAIRKKTVPSFETLCSSSDWAFYEKDKGTNYAQARYLCYYLQQRDLLRKFYRQFRANCREDPTGYDTLQDVLGRPDMAAFQKEWEAFVLKLRFP